MTRLFSVIAVLVLSLVQPVSSQTDFSNVLSTQSPTFLDVESAFQFDFKQDGQQLVVNFTIADGYYLYKHQFKGASKDAVIQLQPLPKGVEKYDEFFGDTEVYYNAVALTYAIDSAPADAVVKIRYQGCAEAGLCYPPTVKEVFLSAVNSQVNDNGSADSAPRSQQFELSSLLSSEQSLWFSLSLFLGLGILLAFTPCVFPMYPILSSVVLGYKNALSVSQALKLSFVYVQGMAITYSLLGLAVAVLGAQFQVWLQHPAVLGVMIVLFCVVALAMFGAFELNLPSAWQQRLNSISQQQTAGQYGGVFVMGVISGLVASPCTTAPLTGILLFIAQSGDLTLGFFALYALSMGMGIPLMLFAVTGGKLLPKAGAWMDIIKAMFGFMLLSVAILFIERLFTAPWTTWLWVALLIAWGGYLVRMSLNYHQFVSRLALYLPALALLSGAVYLGTQQTQTVQHPAVDFVKVKDFADFEAKRMAANQQGKTVLLDLYADWCVACKEFEHKTFPAPEVQTALENTILMQVDLTENTPRTQAFWDNFNVLGLPTLLLFDTNGNELDKQRVTGFMNAEDFAQHVDGALNKG